MNTASKKREERAMCEHTHVTREYYLGSSTGDKVCNSCDETFSSTEKIIPVEYRSKIIMSSHALLVVLKLNKDLKLEKSVSQHGQDYDWALVQKEDEKVIIQVASDVAEKCISAGYIILNG
jgi:hypothetical protein